MNIGKLLTILILCSMTVISHATEKLYKIELVIFAQDMPNTEVFDQTESQIRWPRQIRGLASFQQVDSANMRLHGSYAQLARGQNYQPLMHVAWIQSVGAHRLGAAVQISNAEGTINGFFRLQRGNLIQMIADIEYSPDPYVGAVIYRLHEKRRFKLNETHYLDHPKFGILVRVSPL